MHIPESAIDAVKRAGFNCGQRGICHDVFATRYGLGENLQRVRDAYNSAWDEGNALASPIWRQAIAYAHNPTPANSGEQE